MTKTPRKLTLKTETVRAIDAEHLALARGGSWSAISVTCYTCDCPGSAGYPKIPK